MSIIFGPYAGNTGSFPLRRRQHLRLSDRQNLFALHRQPRLAMSTSTTAHATMALHRQPQLRMSGAGANVFLLHRQPRLAMSGSLPIPTATVFMLSGPGHTLVMNTTITTHATMALHRQPQLLMSDATARFALHRQPRLYMSDGHVSLDRTALLLQQPYIHSTVFKGVRAALSDTWAASDTFEAQFIHALFDTLSANDSLASLVHVLQSIDSSFAAHDSVSALQLAALLDTFAATDTLDHTAQITAFFSDGFVLDDGLDATAQVMAALSDNAFFTVTLNTGDAVYSAWVMTPETRAMRSYSNFPFNSFAMLNGKLLAASSDGIYQLGGTTDAGDIIKARVRSGLMDFGTRALKRIDRAYLGYTSSGTLCMRVCATTETGDKTEYTYKMVAQPASAPRQSRVPIGRGVRSAYWSFELCTNADGSAFELYDITVLPMVLTRRVV